MKTAKEILKECSNNNKDDHGHIVYYDWEVLNAMKEACKQQRKICANSANFILEEEGGLDKESAKLYLKNKGYYTDNLWTINDVQDRFECTEEEAYEVLDKTLQCGRITEEIFETIDLYAEELNLKVKENEIK